MFTFGFSDDFILNLQIIQEELIAVGLKRGFRSIVLFLTR